MTPADAVLGDALREAGYARVTPWRLRAVEAYLANSARDPMRPGRSFDRLLNDLRYSLDHQHGEAWWFDGRWMVARGPERELLRRHFGIAPRVGKTP